jgi:hypothetical protein
MPSTKGSDASRLHPDSATLSPVQRRDRFGRCRSVRRHLHPDGPFNDLHGHDALVSFVHYWRDKMNGADMRHWNTNLAINPAVQGTTGSVYPMLINISVQPPVIALAANTTINW